MSDKKMTILKNAETTPSLSGRSMLSYQIGIKDDTLHITLTGNTGKGIFNKDWIPLAEISGLLNTDQPITSGSLQGLFEGRSSNSAGFLLAVLLNEGLAKKSDSNGRYYERVDLKEYEKIIQAYTKTRPGKKTKGAK